MERAQYDTAIHSNPDADTWAKFFKEHFPDGKEVPDLDAMRGWFANAMMAMHDHIKQASDIVLPVMRSLPNKIETEDYIVQNHRDYPDGRKNIVWIENSLGEGMGLCLDELWQEKF